MRSLSLWRRTLSLHRWTCNLLPLHYKMKHWAGYWWDWKLNIFEVKCCWNLVFLIKLLWGEITYLFDLIWKSVRLIKIKEIPVLDPGKSLFNIKAEKVVRFFYFKVNTNKFVFLNKLFINGLFYGFLDHHNRHDLRYLLCRCYLMFACLWLQVFKDNSYGRSRDD